MACKNTLQKRQSRGEIIGVPTLIVLTITALTNVLKSRIHASSIIIHETTTCKSLLFQVSTEDIIEEPTVLSGIIRQTVGSSVYVSV